MSKKPSSWLYPLLGGLLKGLAYMPFWVLYRLSDLLFVLIYYVVRYRRSVVCKNIAESFPEYTPKQVRQTARNFYRHFCDLFFETIKLGHVTDEEMRRRMVFENMEMVEAYVEQNRSMVCYFSHCMNWEWAPAITLWMTKKHENFMAAQVYRPLANSWFDSYFLGLRSRFGSVSIAKQSVVREMIMLRRQGKCVICGFMSDQKPSHSDPGHPMMFLNHPTKMITGPEMLARKLNHAVVYMDMHRVSRGHYKIVMRLVADNPSEEPEMQITERYARMLEETIRRNPSIWLWSHKRWKHPVTIPES